MNPVLDTIVAGLHRTLPEREARVPVAELKASPLYDRPCFSLVDDLAQEGRTGVIAELCTDEMPMRPGFMAMGGAAKASVYFRGRSIWLVLVF